MAGLPGHTPALLHGHLPAFLLAHLLLLGPHLLVFLALLVLLVVEHSLDCLDNPLEAPLLPLLAVTMAPVGDALCIPPLHLMLVPCGPNSSLALSIGISFHFVVFLVLMLSLMRRSLVDLGSYRWLVARGRWLVARGRWLVARGRWLVTAGRWLVTAGRWLVTRSPLCDLMFFLNTCLLLLLSLLIFLVLRRPVDTTGGVDWCRGAIADGRGRLVNGGCRAAIARALGDIGGRLG